MKYLYSIIIPHFNSSQLLERMLNSIPRRDDIQIIVVDDNSNEIEKGELRKIRRPNVELYFQTTNHGAGFARNVGLDHVLGQWVIVADADDVFAPNAFETVFRIRLYLCLILCDVALDCFPANTNSAGYLPLTQTINAMVMEDLFFLVHVYHVLTNYTLQCSYESPYI